MASLNIQIKRVSLDRVLLLIFILLLILSGKARGREAPGEIKSKMKIKSKN